ncbi:MAG: ATP-dependent helicase, partial [bacterium]|nr:ATP-dependent helicase [bacterium]
ELNYRSTPEILALANASIACNRHRLPKELRAVRASGLKPAYVVCRDHYVQARFIGEFILHLLDENRRLNDIAVLYRSHWHALELELELRARNIPYQVRGGIRFFEQAHIKDVVSFLRLVQNPRDELAWRRCLLLLPRIGPRQAGRVWEQIAQADDAWEEARAVTTIEVLAPAARPFYQQLMQLLEELRSLGAPGDMIDAVLNSFYGDYLEAHYEGAVLRKEDIRGLANFAAQYQTLEAFLSDVSLAGEFEGETCKAGPEEQEFVILSTVHQAKGLEWPVVIIPWLADGRFPTDLAINTEEEEEEERRVFHVATTRAKDELYLVVPQMYYSRGVQTMMKPSRFLTEIPAGLYEAMELYEDLPEVTVGRRGTREAIRAR